MGFVEEFLGYLAFAQEWVVANIPFIGEWLATLLEWIASLVA